MKGFKQVFLREFRRIFTNRDLLLLCFVAPLIYGIGISSVYWHQRVRQVPIGVVDEDHTALSRALIRQACATENVALGRRYASMGEAAAGIAAGEVEGLLCVPRGFGAVLKRGEDAVSMISVNSSNFLTANPVMQTLMEASADLSARSFAEQMRKRGAAAERAAVLAQPVALDARAVYNPGMSYANFFLPGILFVVLQQIILVGLGFSVSDEREKGRGPRLLRLAEGRPAALLFGKILPYAIVNFFMGLFFIYAVLPCFGISVHGNHLSVIAFMAAFVCAMTAFGIMISSFFRSVAMALIVLMFYSMPTFLLSGFSWPLCAMPWYMRGIAFIFPSTYFLADFRVVLLGGVSLARYMGSLAALGGFTVICCIASYFFFRRVFRAAK